MIRVVLDSLVKRFGRAVVVDDLSLEIRAGERLHLLGAARAGKTTLARLVVGLDQPDAGEIYFDGRPMRRVPPGERRVGSVFGTEEPWPHFRVAESIGYGLKLQGVGRRERRQRVAEALAAVRLDSLAERRPAALTAAQRRRVLIARALATAPALLVLDEPLRGLEGPERDGLAEDLHRLLANSAATVLVLTHDPREALAQADCLAVLDLGRIAQSGPPCEVYNRPADAFVAELLGPINLISGQLETTDARGGAVVRTPLGRLVGLSAAPAPPGGSPVTVAIRPEALALGAAPSTFGGNRFPAVVERQVFLGGICEVRLRGAGDLPLTARVLPPAQPALRTGQSATVTVAPEFVVILPSRANRTAGH